MDDFNGGIALAREINEQIGTTLKARRGVCGYSQAQVATLLRDVYEIPWHQTAVAKVEAGERPLRLNEAVALAHLYGIGLEDLVRGTNIVKRPWWHFIFDEKGRVENVDIGIGEEEGVEVIYIPGPEEGWTDGEHPEAR